MCDKEHIFMKMNDTCVTIFFHLIFFLTFFSCLFVIVLFLLWHLSSSRAVATEVAEAAETTAHKKQQHKGCFLMLNY